MPTAKTGHPLHSNHSWLFIFLCQPIRELFKSKHPLQILFQNYMKNPTFQDHYMKHIFLSRPFIWNIFYFFL